MGWSVHDECTHEAVPLSEYFAELDAHPQAWQALLSALGEGDVTLLYSSRDQEHNNAVALRDCLLTNGVTSQGY
jgi:uncharacterized protein YeaO (DUF488 family)